MLTRFLRFLNTPLYFTQNSDKEIIMLRKNQGVMQGYIVALSRLSFISPQTLQREAQNKEANNEFIKKLYEYIQETEKTKAQ